VHCRQCGYNLYGLRAGGACPECGLEVWETILHTVDPAASRLPKLHNPAAVGNALLWLIVCMVVGAVLLIARPIALGIDALDESGLRNLAAWTPGFLPLAASLLALAGLWSVWQLAPPRGEEPSGAVCRDVWLLGAGLVPGVAVVGLAGLRGVLETIGLRSRLYRTARTGRQGIQGMVAAILGTALGHAVHLIAAAAGGLRYLETLGTVIVIVSVLMLVVGLVYLVVNAWWIRRALHCPPPAMDEILKGTDSFSGDSGQNAREP
jgi:threonine/homoserine/homoserine lactone efflux protein